MAAEAKPNLAEASGRSLVGAPEMRGMSAVRCERAVAAQGFSPFWRSEILAKEGACSSNGPPALWMWTWMALGCPVALWAPAA